MEQENAPQKRKTTRNEWIMLEAASQFGYFRQLALAVFLENP